MKNNKIISKLLIALVMIFSVFVTLGNIKTVYAETDPSTAPADWAFEESSIPLHDAILAKYPTVDTNGDGYISESEANTMTGILNVSGSNIAGTINGIEYFTQVTDIRLSSNQLTGEIPVAIKNLTNLNTLYLSVNQLSGTIPAELGELNVTRLYMQDNEFTGTIPALLANNTNLTHLNLARNNLEGTIPSVFENLVNLVELSVAGNNLTGEIPQFIYTLPAISYVNISNNAGMTGNPAEGFKDNPTLRTLNIEGTAVIQAKPEGTNLTTFVYDNLAENLLNSDKTGLADGVTQEDIDRAQESANYWTEPTKSEWQADIDLAQSMLDAKKEVSVLFNDDKSDLVSDVAQADIDNAQDLVNVLPEGALKDELQGKIDEAQKQLDEKNDAKDKVEDLFNPEGTIKDTVDQGKIDEAQEAVDKLPDGTLKDELQSKIDDAQKQLDELNKKTSDEPVISKPSTGTGSTTNGITPATSDTTNVAALVSLLISSLAVIWFSTKRKLEEE